MDALGVDDSDDTPAMAAVCDAYRATRITDTTFRPIKPSGKKHNSLAGQLSMVAAAVKAAVPTRVYPCNWADSTPTLMESGIAAASACRLSIRPSPHSCSRWPVIGTVKMLC